MTLPVTLLVVFLVALVTSLAVASRLTRVVVKGRARELSREWTDRETPRLGGVAVFAALPVSVLAGVAARGIALGKVPELPDLAGTLILAAAILFVVGLRDDIRGVTPAMKLLAQIAAAGLVFFAGFAIRNVSLMPGHVVHLGMLSLPITVLWLVGVSNAFNLVDGMDGLAGGIALIGLLASATAALILGNPTVPIYTITMAGAVLGFLYYNWPGARLFMGDSGSLVIGFLLAVFSVKGATDHTKMTYGLVPIFALAYPLLDTAVAMLRRWLRGLPLSRADRRHMHHQLRMLGLGPRRSLLLIYAFAGAVAAVGVLASFAPPEVTFATTILGIAGLLALVTFSISQLQYHEFSEAGSSIANAARNAPSIIRDKIHARDIAAIIRQSRTIDDVQAVLEDSAPMFRFAYMKLATPQTRSRVAGRHTQELQTLKMWKLEYPIVHGNPEHYDGLCLTIWCDLGVPQRPAGAERVAQILGPAIAEWASAVQLTPMTISLGGRPLQAPLMPSTAIPSEDERAMLRVPKWIPNRGAGIDRHNGTNNA